MDNTGTDRPERRTALVGRELARYGIDIAALSETRLANSGQIVENRAGYTFFWSGRGENERREAGVGFAIKSHLVSKLASLPTAINDRLMTLKLPLVGKKQATFVSVYAPTMTNPDDIKDKFYEDLDSIISTTPNSDKLIILGDFNARVGRDYHSWKGVLGVHGIGNCNSNGLLLLRTCAEHELLLTNTIFQLPTRKKTTWMHPRSGHWHLIDYIIVRSRDRKDVQVTKAMCGADCWTDHRLIISKLKLRIQPPRRPQGKTVSKRLHLAGLEDQGFRQHFSDALDSRLENLSLDSGSIEDDWAAFRCKTYASSQEILGCTTRKHQDWFDDNDDEIKALLDEKHRLHKEYLSDRMSPAKKAAFCNARKQVQFKLRKMKDNWLKNKSKEIQNYADTNNTKKFFSAVKAVYGPQKSGSSPLLSEDGSTLLTEKEKILDRWAEHFNNVLNRPSTINEEAINQLPQVEVNTSLSEPPTLEETAEAINLLSNGKAPGPDAIPAEVYKAGGHVLVEKLTVLFQSMWNQEAVPQEFKDASIIHLYKRKGNRQSCDNHRGISLLSIAGKILARIILNRLICHLDQMDLLPESQCGFRKDRSTTDMIFAARQLQEKCQEQNLDLYLTFVDLTKAFDTVCREGLWKIMAKFGCPEKLINMVRQFHDGMMATVQDQNASSASFPVTNGVKQGCVLAPTLFSIMFSAMLQDAFADDSNGIKYNYRFDGDFFKLRRLQAKTKIQEGIARDFLFADDSALAAGSEADMQQTVNLFSSACDKFGLTISTKKTEVMYQPAPGKPYAEPTITVNNEKLPAADNFTYLGSTLSRSVNIDAEVNSRIAKASAAFGRLRNKVWEREGITLNTKIKVYQAIVMPSLLYGCETWTVYQRHARTLNRFHLNCLRKILRIRWQDKIPDTEVLNRSNMMSIHTMLMKYQLRWTGHLIRMEDSRIPKQIFYSELQSGKRSRGAPKKRFKDTLKASLKSFDVDLSNWNIQAQQRDSWRSTITNGATSHEANRIQQAKLKRQQRKSRTASIPTADSPSTVSSSSVTCSVCHRSFRAKIGLISHMRTHASVSS